MSNKKPDKKKSILFLIRNAPYATSMNTASIDIMLTAAVFDQDITLVFEGNGIYQLLKDQQTSRIGVKSIGQVFPALELYDVHKVLVEESAVQVNAFTKADFCIPVEFINHNKLANLLELADQVFTF